MAWAPDQLDPALEAAISALSPHGTKVLNVGSKQVFVKFGTGGFSAGSELLQCEATGLDRLGRTNSSIRVPQPLLVGNNGGEGFIALEYIDFGAARRSGDEGVLLGSGLAELHQALPPVDQTFGFPLDWCCGALAQPNNVEGRQINWVEFWSEYRLGHQLSAAKESYPLDTQLQEAGAQLQKRLPELFSMLVVEDIQPSILHGDLWSGNFAYDSDGSPCIFDPAAYYGHDEADLGIANMFGGFAPGFWSAYHAQLPKRPGHKKRAALYELHHHLNHYNIFGAGYRSGCLALIDSLLR